MFLKINRDCQQAYLDKITVFLREPKFWIPLYLFMLLMVLLNFGKKAWAWALYWLITNSAIDFISSKIFKPFFGRPRPCADMMFSNEVRLLALYCGGNGSMPSSHAANHFGVAMFFYITLRHQFPKAVWLFFAWAAAVCFAQVYVGVHYPSDILAGSMFGILMGGLTGSIFNRQHGKLQTAAL
ncbi:MAG: phosphatase PAP2 family protein [Sphingobacteriales bacterium]|nr:MAG: phosphatase PAP2 family protein [Sphingobacteriales bacterium]